MNNDRDSRRFPYKEVVVPQLRSFCEVCRLGSYAAAARAQKVTTSAIWEQMKGLERYYRVTLFDRRGNRVRPTLHGRRLLELVRPVLAELDSIRLVINDDTSIFPARMSIVTNLRVLVEEVSTAIANFRQRYPQIAVQIDYHPIEIVHPLVVQGNVDIAMTLEPGPDQPRHAAVQYEPAGELDYLLVTPPRHPLLRMKPLELEAIVKYPLVLSGVEGYSRHRVHEVFHRHGLTEAMNVVVQTSSDEYTVACVRAGTGVGVTIGNPASALYRDLGTRSLRPWFGPARVGFLWRRRSHLSTFQQELANELRSTLPKLKKSHGRKKVT